MKVIEIHVGDDGTFMVGCPPEEGAAPMVGEESLLGGEAGGDAEADYLQPARNLEEAIAMVRELASGETPEAEMQAESDMDAGYKAGRGDAEG